MCYIISYGYFERHFMLPEGVKTDELKAKFSNGILEITVPAPTTNSRRIEIETSKDTNTVTEGEKNQESCISNYQLLQAMSHNETMAA
jgi:hypothetical protein